VEKKENKLLGIDCPVIAERNWDQLASVAPA
jgi:hypothetical protein